MKAYILEGPNSIKAVEKEIPPLKEYEVLVKVTNIGICGSDIHLFKGTYNGPFEYPMLFGHEWSGIVSRVGSSVKKVKPGDKVTGDCSKYCGVCINCSKDKNLCQNIEKFGITVDGASAEYIIRDEKYIYKAPQDSDLELICLTEPIAVAAHLIRKIDRLAEGVKDKKILIYGGGAIGIAALLILKRKYNCENVELFDVVENRVKLAKELGADIPSKDKLEINPDRNDYNSLYTKALYDVVIETTGDAGAFKNTFEVAKPSGIIGCAGMMPEVGIEQKLIVVKALNIIGSIGGTGEFPGVLEFIRDNSEHVRRLISHRFSINNVNKAFDISRNTSEVLKIELIL